MFCPECGSEVEKDEKFCADCGTSLQGQRAVAFVSEQEFKGYNGTMVVTGNGVIIKRGAKGFLFGGGKLRGNKTIPYQSIVVAVQLKKAGLTAGYLQLTLKGGSEAKSGLMQSTTDENSVNFYSRRNQDFEEAKRLIEERVNIVATPETNASTSAADEIKKLAELKAQGILTEEEFQKKKEKLLDL